MSEDKSNELLQDIEELKSLLTQAKRTRVQQLLQASVKQLETELAASTKLEDPAPPKEKKPVIKPKSYDVQITNYAWDQSDAFVKLYVTLEGVHQIPAENVTCNFTQRSAELIVNDLNGKNHILRLLKLMNPIQQKVSYYKVKTDKVVVFMKKEKSQNWSHLTAQEKKVKEKPEMKEDADPSSGLMDLMRQMYEDGDDEMKRTIAKAWTESREKGAAGGGYDI